MRTHWFSQYYCDECKILVGKRMGLPNDSNLIEYVYHVINYECFHRFKLIPCIYDELKKAVLQNTNSKYIIDMINKIDNEKVIKEIIE